MKITIAHTAGEHQVGLADPIINLKRISRTLTLLYTMSTTVYVKLIK